jgi:protein required for attachment to host cells
MNADRTLVAVFDAAHVRFFAYKRARGRLEPVLGDMSAGLHHDGRDIEKHDFVKAVATAIEAALDRDKFNKLVVVAPSRSIGEFRELAGGKVKAALWREVAKDLARLGDAELENHLVPILQVPDVQVR